MLSSCQVLTDVYIMKHRVARQLDIKERSGIATSVIVIVIVVVLAVGGAGAYFALTSGGSGPTTTPSTTSVSTTTPAGTTSTTKSATSTTPVSTSSSGSVSTSPSTTTVSCSTTGSTTAGTTDYTPQYIATVVQFSAMEFGVNGTYNNGSPSNETLSYMVTSASGGIYNMSMTFNSGSENINYTFVLDANNNTVLSATTSGYTTHGSQAKMFFDDSFALFGLEYSYGGAVNTYTNPTWFHSEGTASQTFGTTTFPVTTYGANNLPFTMSECGQSSTITKYTLGVGTPPGTSLQFITLIHIATSSPTTEDITFRLISMTVA